MTKARRQRPASRAWKEHAVGQPRVAQNGSSWLRSSNSQLQAPGGWRKAAMYDAALVRCIDFEREFGKLPTDAQTLLLLAYREKQPQRTIAQITGWSPRAISYKLPAALLDLARLLDKADLL